MKIYTKTGDLGQTGLLGGVRVSKDAVRIEAYGTIDELNAQLGLARSALSQLFAASEEAANGAELDTLLAAIQNQLFDLGAQLASPKSDKDSLAQVTAPIIQGLEQAIDRYEATLPQLRQFILPGGTTLAAQLHVARTVCRRAERRAVTLANTEPVTSEAIVYLNRLSDLLFVLARAANQLLGQEDVFWKPGN